MKKQKILVAGLGRIGDLVLITPIFQALKQDNPEHEIHLLAGRNNYQAVLNHPSIDHVHVYWKKPLNTLQLLHALRKAKFDIWIDPKDHKSSESRFFARIGNAPVSVGYNGYDDKRKRIFTHAVTPGEDQLCVHATERVLSALRPLGIKATETQPLLRVDGQAERALQDFLTDHAIDSYYFVNISATCEARQWPAENWIVLLKEIEAQARRFVLCSMPKDVPMAEQIIRNTNSAFLYQTKSIRDAMSAVKHAKVILTVDTSIVHIASAFNIPILSLHANLYREYTKYYPLSDHRRCVMAPGEGTFVDQIPLDVVVQEYHSLWEELQEAAGMREGDLGAMSKMVG